MNRWMSTDVDMSGTTQFEGRTAEEAVARARAALGDSGALRCWKTRRGGVGGFFAKEIFVAGLTPPPGSEKTRGRASWAQQGQKRGAPVVDGTKSASAIDPVLEIIGWARGPPRRADRSHFRSSVLGTAGDPGRGVRRGPGGGAGGVDARTSRQRHRRSRRDPCRFGSADHRHRGTCRLRAAAPTSRQRPRRGPAQPTRGRHRNGETAVARRWGATDGGATRQEGDTAQGKGRTHAASSAAQPGDDARTARSTGAHARPEARPSQPGRARLLRATRTAPLAGPVGHCHGDPAGVAAAADPHRRGGGGRRVGPEP